MSITYLFRPYRVTFCASLPLAVLAIMWPMTLLAASDREKISTTGQSVVAPVTAAEVQADRMMAIHQYMSAIHLYESIPSPNAPLLNKTGIAYEKMRMYAQRRLLLSSRWRRTRSFQGQRTTWERCTTRREICGGRSSTTRRR